MKYDILMIMKKTLTTTKLKTKTERNTKTKTKTYQCTKPRAQGCQI